MILEAWEVIVLLYIATSVVLYFVCRNAHSNGVKFKAPKKKWVFYLLSFTWGLISVIPGLIVAGVLMLAGHKPIKYGYEWYFALPGISWGLELGIIFLAPEDASESLKQHEHGHGIQNIWLGIFTPAVVSIPSAIRFWYRKIVACSTKYDDIWFEGSATAAGKEFMETHGKNC